MWEKLSAIILYVLFARFLFHIFPGVGVWALRATMASGFRSHDPTQKTNVSRNCIKKSFAENVQSVKVLHLTSLYLLKMLKAGSHHFPTNQ